METDGGQALDRLWALQQVDIRLAGARASLGALDDGAALRAEAEAARREAADADARLHACQAAVRDHELRLATTEDKQRKIEGDLYGGRVSNPKELSSMQEELGMLARTRDGLEDRILALFEEQETLKERAAAAAHTRDALAQRLAAHLAAYGEARARLQAEIAALVSERGASAQRVDPRLLKRYEGIAAQEGGVGIVAIQEGRCAGCHNALPTGFVARVREGQLVICERCRRILYLAAS